MRRLVLFPFTWVLVLCLAACQRGEAPGGPTPAVSDSVVTPSLHVSMVDGVGGYVEDFEDRARAEAVWLAVADGQAEARVYAQPGGRGPASQYHLAVEATRPADPGPTDTAGAIARLAPADGVAAGGETTDGFDASAFRGLRLALRGTPGTYIVQLGAARVEDYDHFNAYVQLASDDWTLFEVPFAQFSQEGYGAPVAWTGADLIHLAVYALPGGAVTFGIDDVVFF